jgi:hypothetical protein
LDLRRQKIEDQGFIARENLGQLLIEERCIRFRPSWRLPRRKKGCPLLEDFDDGSEIPFDIGNGTSCLGVGFVGVIGVAFAVGVPLSRRWRS